jgi:hypothetical protein
MGEFLSGTKVFISFGVLCYFNDFLFGRAELEDYGAGHNSSEIVLVQTP